MLITLLICTTNKLDILTIFTEILIKNKRGKTRQEHMAKIACKPQKAWHWQENCTDFLDY